MRTRMLTLLPVCTAAVVCMMLCVAVSADPPADTTAVLSGPPAVATDSAPAPDADLTPDEGPTAISDPTYVISPDDVIKMDVWGEPQLSGAQLAVTPDGTVSVPFLGEIKIAGLTQTEVAKIVAAKLQEAEILADARVQITLINMHRPQARILGAVQRPCAFEFKEGDTILNAIAQGGSYAADAMLESVSLIRKDSDKAIMINLRKLFAGDLTQNYKLQNGDALYIPHEDYRNKFYVFGHVNRPGQYSLKENTDVLTAISLAGGQAQRASVRNTVVVRTVEGKPERVKANLSRLFDKGDLSQNIALQSGDIIIVPETKSPDMNKISQFISTIVNLGYLSRLGWL